MRCHDDEGKEGVEKLIDFSDADRKSMSDEKFRVYVILGANELQPLWRWITSGKTVGNSRITLNGIRCYNVCFQLNCKYFC